LVTTGAAGARTSRGAFALAGVALVGFAAEIAGANTGLPFGAYEYTDALRPRLFGAPPVIGLAWMVLAAMAWSIVAPLKLPRTPAVLLAATWTTAVDLVIDPLAANQFDYWRWAEGGLYHGIPASNFAGWLFISLLALGLFAERLEPSFRARAVGFAIVLFFALAAASYGLALPAAVGFGLCAAQLLVAVVVRGRKAVEAPQGTLLGGAKGA